MQKKEQENKNQLKKEPRYEAVDSFHIPVLSFCRLISVPSC